MIQYGDPCAQVYQALLARGADPITARILTAIAWAESGCRASATRRCPPDCVPGQAPEYSVGPFQINLRVHPISEECARDVWCAAGYVLRLPFQAWTTFRTGKYKESPWLAGTGPLEAPRIGTATPTVTASPELKRNVTVAVSLLLLVVAGSVLLRRRR